MELNFYPGPSFLYPQVEKYLAEAYQSGVLGRNHRSPAFMELLGRTVSDLKAKLDVPADYEVYFTSSATEGWEIVSQSLVVERSLHAYNGAFGRKWYEYAGRLHKASACPFDLDKLPPLASNPYFEHADTLCLTHNETSNGTRLPEAVLQEARSSFGGLIAVDATSSMAGVRLPWWAADVWLASVQKCFGLPSGLGVLVVSPRAVERAQQINDRARYNSLLFVRDNFLNNQTPYTPNILGIYLLGRVMAQVPGIREVEKRLEGRAQRLYAHLALQSVGVLCNNQTVRSTTVLAVQGNPEWIEQTRQRARRAGIVLGNGYGALKESTLRIANFPALPDAHYARLMAFFKSTHSGAPR